METSRRFTPGSGDCVPYVLAYVVGSTGKIDLDNGGRLVESLLNKLP